MRAKRLLWAVVLLVVLVVLAPFGLTALGNFLVADETPEQADAVVVLNTGVDIYPRLFEAARLYSEGYAKTIVINGNRKNATYRELEAMGYRRDRPWDYEGKRILAFLGVPAHKVISVDAEDAFDTITEARAVVSTLKERGIERVLVTTSRFHTGRARAIWKYVGGESLTVRAVAARKDPFQPDGWWREPRHIRWVLAEYGGWLLFWWQRLID